MYKRMTPNFGHTGLASGPRLLMDFGLVHQINRHKDFLVSPGTGMEEGGGSHFMTGTG